MRASKSDFIEIENRIEHQPYTSLVPLDWGVSNDIGLNDKRHERLALSSTVITVWVRSKLLLIGYSKHGN